MELKQGKAKRRSSTHLWGRAVGGTGVGGTGQTDTPRARWDQVGRRGHSRGKRGFLVGACGLGGGPDWCVVRVSAFLSSVGGRLEGMGGDARCEGRGTADCCDRTAPHKGERRRAFHWIESRRGEFHGLVSMTLAHFRDGAGEGACRVGNKTGQQSQSDDLIALR